MPTRRAVSLLTKARPERSRSSPSRDSAGYPALIHGETGCGSGPMRKIMNLHPEAHGRRTCRCGYAPRSPSRRRGKQGNRTMPREHQVEPFYLIITEKYNVTFSIEGDPMIDYRSWGHAVPATARATGSCRSLPTRTTSLAERQKANIIGSEQRYPSDRHERQRKARRGRTGYGCRRQGDAEDED